MSEQILILPPGRLSPIQCSKLIDHIASGEEVNKRFVEAGVPRSQLIGIIISGDIIISSVVLKNPLASYTERVFRKSKIDGAFQFKHELGYIATNPDYERKGYCQALLKEFLQHIDHLDFFATTRKPSMLHILQKFGMKKVGKIYDEDLQLLTYSPKLVISA